jgi:hypothetical protein
MVILLDVFSRRIVEYHLSFRCRAKEWLVASDRAVQREFPVGTRGEDLTLRMERLSADVESVSERLGDDGH